MDFAALLTPPVIAIAAALVVVSAWIGYAIGRSNENKRKQLALAEADDAAKAALEGLRAEHEEQVKVLNKASSNELEELKKTHSQQIDQINRAHQTLVDSLKVGHAGEIERLGNEHGALIDKLNAANIANINQLKKEQESQIAQIDERAAAAAKELKAEAAASIASLKGEHKAALEQLTSQHQDSLQALRQDHQRAIVTLKQESEQAIRQVEQDRERRIQELEQRNAQEAARLSAQVSGLTGERDRLNAAIAELDGTVAKLQDDIKEAKLKNMFSVSKSGEKLVRVVRTVQELASELDETSRAVTGGEYSFFEEIKDQRDKETVLSLTGGGGAYPHPETTVDASAIDGETDSLAEQDPMGDADEQTPHGGVDDKADAVDEEAEAGGPKVRH